MERFICVTCGTQFPDATTRRRLPDLRRPAPVRPARRASVDDARRARAPTTRNEFRDEGDARSASAPSRSSRSASARCSSRSATRNLLWDCVTLLDDATAAEVERRGGLAGDRDLAPALLLGDGRVGAPLRLPDPPARRRRRVGHAARSRRSRTGTASTLELGDGLTLVRGGGHFPGGTMLHRAEGARRAADRRHHPGHPGPRPRRLHVELPEPGPAPRGRGPARSRPRSSRSRSTRSTAPGGDGHPVRRRKDDRPALRRALRARAARGAGMTTSRAPSSCGPARAHASGTSSSSRARSTRRASTSG